MFTFSFGNLISLIETLPGFHFYISLYDSTGILSKYTVWVLSALRSGNSDRFLPVTEMFFLYFVICPTSVEVNIKHLLNSISIKLADYGQIRW